MTKTISTDKKEEWTTLRCVTCDKPRKVPLAIWNRKNGYFCSLPCCVTAAKEEGHQVGRDRTIRKLTEEFRKLAERHKYCPQVFGLDRSWITEILMALDLEEQSLPELRAAPLGLLKRARSQMKAELDDPGILITSTAWNGHCNKFLLITERIAGRDSGPSTGMCVRGSTGPARVHPIQGRHYREVPKILDEGEPWWNMVVSDCLAGTCAGSLHPCSVM